MPSRCYSDYCDIDITFNVFGASNSRPVHVIFTRVFGDDSEKLTNISVTSSNIQTITLSLGGRKRETLTVNIPEAISPQDLNGGDDSRVLGIALRTIDIK